MGQFFLKKHWAGLKLQLGESTTTGRSEEDSAAHYFVQSPSRFSSFFLVHSKLATVFFFFFLFLHLPLSRSRHCPTAEAEIWTTIDNKNKKIHDFAGWYNQGIWELRHQTWHLFICRLIECQIVTTRWRIICTGQTRYHKPPDLVPGLDNQPKSVLF